MTDETSLIKRIALTYDPTTRVLKDSSKYAGPIGSSIDSNAVAFDVTLVRNGVPLTEEDLSKYDGSYYFRLDFAVKIEDENHHVSHPMGALTLKDGVYSYTVQQATLKAAENLRKLPVQLVMESIERDQIIVSLNSLTFPIVRAINATDAVTDLPYVMYRDSSWEWQSELVYSTGSIAVWDSRIYASLTDNNRGNCPRDESGVISDQWQEVTGAPGQYYEPVLDDKATTLSFVAKSGEVVAPEAIEGINVQGQGLDAEVYQDGDRLRIYRIIKGVKDEEPIIDTVIKGDSVEPSWDGTKLTLYSVRDGERIDRTEAIDLKGDSLTAEFGGTVLTITQKDNAGNSVASVSSDLKGDSLSAEFEGETLIVEQRDVKGNLIKSVEKNLKGDSLIAAFDKEVLTITQVDNAGNVVNAKSQNLKGDSLSASFNKEILTIVQKDNAGNTVSTVSSNLRGDSLVPLFEGTELLVKQVDNAGNTVNAVMSNLKGDSLFAEFVGTTLNITQKKVSGETVSTTSSDLKGTFLAEWTDKDTSLKITDNNGAKTPVYVRGDDISADFSGENLVVTRYHNGELADTKTQWVDGDKVVPSWDGTTLVVKRYHKGELVSTESKDLKGERGYPFSIDKIYPSIAAMNADFKTSTLRQGALVAIVSDVEDPDNAKLYAKGETDWEYLVDMSGATGIQGPQGIQGFKGNSLSAIFSGTTLTVSERDYNNALINSTSSNLKGDSVRGEFSGTSLVLTNYDKDGVSLSSSSKDLKGDSLTPSFSGTTLTVKQVDSAGNVVDTVSSDLKGDSLSAEFNGTTLKVTQTDVSGNIVGMTQKDLKGEKGDKGVSVTATIADDGQFTVINTDYDGTEVSKYTANITGPMGPGLPSGGNTGQIVTKSGETDYDYTWSDPLIKSVNGKTGTVTLTYSDVDALSDATQYVSAVNGLDGAVTLKTVNNNVLTGSGNISVQPVLMDTGSGQNIKTLNNKSLLGAGNITIPVITVDTTLDKDSANPVENQAIARLIPDEASETNQLADKAFVNSSISTNTATFRGTYAVADLGGDITDRAAVATNLKMKVTAVDSEDYVFVELGASGDDAGQYDRYKWNGTSWAYEYTLNNSSFTSAQWGAINSGVTAAAVKEHNDDIDELQSQIKTAVTSVTTGNTTSAKTVLTLNRANGGTSSDVSLPVVSSTSSGVMTSAVYNDIYDTINTHIANKSNPHSVTKAQVGLGNADNTSDADKPISTATQDALDTITDTIDAHTTNTSNPHEVTKEQVGLGNVDNTADVDKPISKATQTALDTITTNLSTHASDTSNPHEVTKEQVGLGKADNTADIDKPISKATQTALNTLTTSIDTHKADTTNPHKVTKAQVGLSNVDNTADLDKPISTATEKELNIVAFSLSSHTRDEYNPHNVTKAQVGLSNVDNTADLDKPISTLTQNALDTITSDLSAHTADKTNPHSVTKAQVGLGSADNTADAVKNVLSATKLTTGRKIGISGVTATTQTFDGTKDITIPVTVVPSSLLTGTISDERIPELAISKITDLQDELDSKALDSTLTTHIGDVSNPHKVTKVQVGLSDVDNTSDLAKPISTATQTALDKKADKTSLDTHTANTSNPHKVTKAQLGLGNVDNTSDADKPISTATQTALDTHTDSINAVTTDLATHLADEDNPHKVTKAQLGLGNVDNTSDLNKPISTATQTALNKKVDAVAGKGLSTNDYTTAEKNKLSGIDVGAEVNVIEGIQVDGVDQTLTNKKYNLKTTGTAYPSTAGNDAVALKGFVNSSINAIAAFYITKNAAGDPFTSNAELTSATTFYSGGEVRTPTRNDYCIVLKDEVNGGETAGSTRYIYDNGWEFQYSLNYQFTQAQMDALNSGINGNKTTQISANQSAIATINNSSVMKSGITSALVGQIGTNKTNIESLTTRIGTAEGEIDSLQSGKQDKLSDTQTAAINSGITKTIVGQISTNAGNITALQNGKQDKLSDTQTAAINSGITESLVKQINTNKTDIAALDGRADDCETAIGTANTNISNNTSAIATINESAVMTSGITSAKVTQIQTNTNNIANKVDKVTGKGLSTNDYTTDEKNKLSGIESKAQVNKLEAIKVNGVAQTITDKTVDLSITSSTLWGEIGGTLSDQTDLNDELTTINGNITTVSGNLSTHTADTSNPHKVTKAQVGLGNVDNTSDANKPISTATQTALNKKVDAVAGKGLSTNDFTGAYKTKLDGIDSGAEVNVIETVKVDGTALTVTGKAVNIDLSGKASATTVSSHISNTSNPHSVTKAQVGLGNVDNTSDANKPISTATQTALNNKVTKSSTASVIYGTNSSKADTTYALSTSVSSSSTDSQIPTAKAVYNGLSSKQNTLSYSLSTATPSSSSTDTQVPSSKAVYTALSNKQDKLTSGTNIKTINSNSLLGSGNIAVQSTLSSTQLAACNSGITSTKVSKYDAYDDSKQDRIILTSAVVDWESDTTYTSLGFTYKGTIYVNGCTSSHSANVTFDLTTATSGKVAPICETDTDAVYVWAKENLGSISVDVAVIPGQ